MNFNKFDVLILLTMSLAVIGMSFTFPALGLTGEDPANSSEIPELDIEQDRFDIVGDLPERPSTTDSGRLTYRPDGFDDRQIWIEHDGTNGIVSAETFVESDGNTPPVTVQLSEFSSSDGSLLEQDTATLNETGDRVELTVNNETDYTVRYELVELENNGTSDFESTVSFEVVDSPGGDGFLGSLLGAGDSIASTLAWVGLVFYWFSVSIFEIAGNALGAIYDATSYLFSLIAWLTTTYTGIVASAGGFASVFVSIPGILLGAVLAKVVMIAVSLLPTT